MFTKLYWIDTFLSGGAIGIMPRPRGNEWLAGEVERWRETGVKTVVSLLERDEVQELGLQEEDALCRRQGIDYINFPIKDRMIPSRDKAAEKLVRNLVEKLDGGEKMVIHCRMGIGRVSLIAGALLIAKGAGADTAIEKISKARALKVPDTEEQVLWLKSLEKRST